MPTVRAWQQTATTAPLQTPVAQPLDQSGTAALGRGVSQLGGALDQVAEAATQQANDDAVNKALIKAQKAADQAALDARKATLDDAMPASQEAYKTLDASHDEIVGGLTTEAQQRVFEQRFGALRESTRLQIETHVQDQVKASAQANLQAREYLTTQAAAANAYVLSDPRALDNPDALKAVAPIAQLVTDVRTQMQAQGAPAALIEARVASVRSQVSMAVAERLLKDGAYDRADAFVTAHRDELGTAGAELAGRIEERRKLQLAASTAQQAAQQFRMGTGEVNQGAAEAFIGKAIKDPLERAKAMSFLEQEIQRGKAVHDQVVETHTANVMAAFTALDPTTGKPQDNLAAIQLLSPDSWRFLNDPRQSGLKGQQYVHAFEGWAAEAAARARGQRMVPSPEQAKRAIEIEASMYGDPEGTRKTDPSAFASMWMSVNPTTNEPELSQADYQRLGNLFAQMHKPGTPFYLDSPDAMVIKTLREAFPNLKAQEGQWTPTQVQIANELKREVLQKFGGTEKPDPLKLDAFLKERLVKVKVEGRFWGTNEVPAVQAKAQGKPVVGATAPAHAPVAAPGAQPEGTVRVKIMKGTGAEYRWIPASKLEEAKTLGAQEAP